MLAVLPSLQGTVGTRTASAQALTFVELYSLSRSTFDKVGSAFSACHSVCRLAA